MCVHVCVCVCACVCVCVCACVCVHVCVCACSRNAKCVHEPHGYAQEAHSKSLAFPDDSMPRKRQR